MRHSIYYECHFPNIDRLYPRSDKSGHFARATYFKIETWLRRCRPAAPARKTFLRAKPVLEMGLQHWFLGIKSANQSKLLMAQGTTLPTYGHHSSGFFGRTIYNCHSDLYYFFSAIRLKFELSQIPQWGESMRYSHICAFWDATQGRFSRTISNCMS